MIVCNVKKVTLYLIINANQMEKFIIKLSVLPTVKSDKIQVKHTLIILHNLLNMNKWFIQLVTKRMMFLIRIKNKLIELFFKVLELNLKIMIIALLKLKILWHVWYVLMDIITLMDFVRKKHKFALSLTLKQTNVNYVQIVLV